MNAVELLSRGYEQGNILNVQLAVRMLLRSDQVDLASGLGQTALILSSKHGDVESVKEFLERGVAVDKQDNAGFTAVHYATMGGHSETLELLLEFGASIHTSCNAGYLPLDLACHEGDIESFRLLVKAGGDPLLPGSHSKSPLHRALDNKHTRFVKQVLGENVEKQYFDINATYGKDKSTFLMHISSAVWGHRVIPSVILAGGDVNAMTTSGGTALMKACLSNVFLNVTTLLNQGADAFSMDNTGNNAFDCAVYAADPQILETLREHYGIQD